MCTSLSGGLRSRSHAGAVRKRAGVARALRRSACAGLGLLGLAAQAAAPAGRLAPQQVILIGSRDGLELSAVPGQDSEASFRAQCMTSPPGGWCGGGTLVARFSSRPTQSIQQAWTEIGGACVSNASYLACPIAPSPDRGVQTVRFIMTVAPGEYSANAGIAQGADGLALSPTSFVIRMHGEGTLELRPPRDLDVSAGGSPATTSLFLRNQGPSTNRGVRVRIGPLPDYLQALVVGDQAHCSTRQDMVECAPFDLAPGTWQELLLAVQVDVSRLPQPLPVSRDIDIDVRSDLGHAQTRFVASVVADRGRP